MTIYKKNVEKQPVTRLLEIYGKIWKSVTAKKVLSGDMQISGMVGAVCHRKIIQCLDWLIS